MKKMGIKCIVIALVGGYDISIKILNIKKEKAHESML